MEMQEEMNGGLMTKKIVYFFYNFLKKFVEKYEQEIRNEAMAQRDKLNGKKENEHNIKLWSK